MLTRVWTMYSMGSTTSSLSRTRFWIGNRRRGGVCASKSRGTTTYPPNPPALRATAPLRGEDYYLSTIPTGPSGHLPTSWGGLLLIHHPHRPFGPPPPLRGEDYYLSTIPTGPSGHLPTSWG